MSRRTKEVMITAEGRDKGKRFFITEMHAYQAEKWAARAAFALGNSGLSVPEGLLTDLGENTPLDRFAAIAAFCGQALFTCQFKDAEPLMQEMLDCVTIRPDPKNPSVSRPLMLGTGPLDEADIEEVKTLMLLRREVLDLHLGFSLAAVASRFWAALAAAQFPALKDIVTSPSTSAA